MKKYIVILIIILLCAIGKMAVAQTVSSQGSATTINQALGGFSAIKGLQPPMKLNTWTNAKYNLGNIYFDSGNTWKLRYNYNFTNYYNIASEHWVDSLFSTATTGVTLAQLNDSLAIVHDTTIALRNSITALSGAGVSLVQLNDSLANYLRTSTAAATYETISGANATTAALIDSIQHRVKYSDTAAMLSGYFRTYDSSSRFNTSNNLVARDGNGNTHANNFESAFIQIGASGTKTLTNASERQQYFANGTGTVTCILPNATTMQNGHVFELNQNGVGTLTVKNAGNTTLFTVPSGGYAYVILTNNGTTNGTWDWHFELPKTAQFGTAGLTMTGNTTADSLFGKASALNIYGTLPIANGGTGATGSTTINGTTIGYGTTNTITATPSGSAGGSLAGTFPNPTIAASGISAGTFAYPTSITFGTDGRATSAVAGSAPVNYTFNAPLSNSAGTVSIPVATGSANGYLSSTDWTTFNGKGSGSVTSVAAGRGLNGGTITTSGTLSIDTSTVIKNVVVKTGNIIYNQYNVGVNTLGIDTVTLTMNTQTANTVLAGPTTGAAASPTFRALVAADLPATAITTTGTQTLSNKRWTARVGSTTSSATPTINTDNYDIYKLTAQAADITSFTTNLSGTPNDGDVFEVQITGTAARAITWGTSFVSSMVTLPTTTTSTATLTVVFQYFTTSSYGNNKWVCLNYF